MKTSFLYKFLTHEVNEKDFIKLTHEEIAKYQSELNKKGVTAYLHVEDDLNFVFSKNHLLALCDYFLSDKINQLQLEYIADSILIGEFVTYESSDLIDFLDEMTDSRINGVISKNEISEIKKILLSEQ